jgi:phosphoglycerate dehydrogenase-like enzyme
MEKKMLYFCSGSADDTGSSEEIIMVPVENVSHWEVAGTSNLDVFFKVNIGQEAVDMDAGTADFNKVRLTVTAGAGNMKSVLQSVAGSINATHSDGLIVIADDENSVYCNPLITACNAITILDAS